MNDNIYATEFHVVCARGYGWDANYILHQAGIADCDQGKIIDRCRDSFHDLARQGNSFAFWMPFTAEVQVPASLRPSVNVAQLEAWRDATVSQVIAAYNVSRAHGGMSRDHAILTTAG
nr:F48 [uncultured bacterium]